MSGLAAAPLVGALLVWALASFGGAPQPAAPEKAREDWSAYLPPGEGKALVVSRCIVCHDLRGTIQLRKSAPAWEAIVLDMGARGAPIALDDIDPLVTYLSSVFGTDAPPFTDANAATRDELVKLPGVTPQAAERLIAARARGPFTSDDQVRKSLGLEPPALEKIKHYLFVKPSTAPRHP